MLRALLLLLLAMVLGAFGPVDPSTHAAQAGAEASAPAGDDCCPPRAADFEPDSEHDGDCCDFDFGRCCAAGGGAVLPVATEVTRLRTGPVQARTHLPPHLLRARSTGPPPTPPPIG